MVQVPPAPGLPGWRGDAVECAAGTPTKGDFQTLFLGGRKVFHSLLQPANAIHQMERKTTNTLSILSKLNSTHDRFKNGGYRLWYKSQQGSAKVTISWLVLWSYPWEVLQVCWNWASSSLQVSKSGTSTLVFHPRSSWHPRCQILHSNLGQKRELPIVFLQKTHIHLQQPDELYIWDPNHVYGET